MTGQGNHSRGVKVFCIARRFMIPRERLSGMTDEERRWRAQWLKDQVLSPEEPKFVPEYYRDTNNIFRRIWQFSAAQFENLCTPLMGKNNAHATRVLGAASLKAIASVYILGYILKYHSNDFAVHRTIEIWQARNIMYPSEPNYPNIPTKTPQEYYDQRFYSSVLCVDVEPPEPPPPPPPVELPDACGTDTTV